MIPYQSLLAIAAGVDVIFIVLASMLGALAYGSLSGEFIALDGVFRIAAIVSVIFVLFAHSRGLYQLQAVLVPALHMKNLVLIYAVTLLTLTNILFLLKVGAYYSRGSVIAFAALSFTLVPAGRFLVARASSIGIRRGLVRGRRVVTVGEASELEKLDAADFFQFAIEEIARFALIQNDSQIGLGESGRRQIARAINLARELHAAEFVLVVPWRQEKMIAELSELLRASPLPAKLFPDCTIRTTVGRRSHLALSAYHAVEIQREPLTRWERIIKRMLDLSLSVIAMFVLSPVLLMVALAIKVDSRGPILFRQRRCGFDNREFVILKFRTMTVLEDGDEIVQVKRGDPRITRLGRLLRSVSIDELSQLINVIRGEMSLVGPRPHAIAHDDEYQRQISSYALRRHVKPGLTGVAQVLGLRGETLHLSQMEERVQKDLWYINNWSLMLDLKIIARTCLVLTLMRHEAY